QTPDYSRADRFLSWNAANLIAGDDVNPNWIAKSDRFWYRNKTGSGVEFVVVDPVRNTKGLLFDTGRLASAMSLAKDTAYDPNKLPFTTFELVKNESAIAFRLGKKQMECDIRQYRCVLGDTLPTNRFMVLSPDSTWEAFVKGYDLYIRRYKGKDTIRLTTDGE